MPRMNLTDDEAKVIYHRRELERVRNLGWNDALDALMGRYRDAPVGSSAAEFRELCEVMKKEVN